MEAIEHEPPCTLVWIDARRAVIARWRDGKAGIEHVESDVPAHHRATGHIRHDPAIRHGGGSSQAAGEPHRLEHLDRFVDRIAGRVAPDDHLLILGPGTVRHRLAQVVRASDERHARSRSVACEPAPRLTDRQLLARLRHLADADPRRRSVGAYRWTGPTVQHLPGESEPVPRRVVAKPRARTDEGLA